MWPDKKGKRMDRRNILREGGNKNIWFPYGRYVYIENSPFFRVVRSKIWNSILILRTLKRIEILHTIILASFSLRRLFEFDFYPTNLLPRTPFPLTFVMENLINYANFRDTHSDDNLMQWYPEEVYPFFFSHRFQIWAQIWLKMELSFDGLR